MNSVNLIGRLTNDLELRYTNTNKAFVRFNLAVNRIFAKENGDKDADFISCVAWEKTAETMVKYLKKGNRIGITGKIQTGKYEREDGSTAYTVDVIANHIEFLESKPKEERPEPEYVSTTKETEQKDSFAEFGEQISIEEDDYLD